jgi:hypothetical protein
MKYRVYYRKSLRDVGFAISNTVNMADYEMIGTINADSLEHLYRDMNAIDGTETCCKMRVRSMSVGDIAIDADGISHYCASFGWAAVGLEEVVR